MDTAAYCASDRVQRRWIILLLPIVVLLSACSQYRRSSTEELSAETQTRVAENLQQSPPASAAENRYPRGVPYQPISADEKQLLEELIVPRLYGEQPVLKVAEVPTPVTPATAAPSPVAMPLEETEPPPPPSLAMTAPPPTTDSGWTPYQSLSAEEQDFLRNRVLPKLEQGGSVSVRRTTPPPASTTLMPRAAPTVIPTAPADVVSEEDLPVATEPSAEEDVEILFSAPPADNPTPAPTTDAHGPRRDKLENSTEDEVLLPGPRLEKLESAAHSPQAQPLLPVPDTDASPNHQQPASQPASPGENDLEELPDSAFPGSGEAVASTDDLAGSPTITVTESPRLTEAPAGETSGEN